MTGFDLTRSLRLLSAFRFEASDPDRFGRVMAADTVELLSRYVEVAGASLVDVGGASGYVAEAIRSAGGSAVTVEYDPVEMNLASHPFSGGVRGDGRRLPIRSGSFDISYSSNVIEHVAGPALMLEEMVRVVRPGGTIMVCFTNWLSPWGGHETSPWHYLGGERAVAYYRRRYGRDPKNYYGRSLFPLHAKDLLGWARRNRSVEVVDAFPRYYPRALGGLVRVPWLREVATWNLALVLHRCG
jgi:SAM-dependent methyltransferase